MEQVENIFLPSWNSANKNYIGGDRRTKYYLTLLRNISKLFINPNMKAIRSDYLAVIVNGRAAIVIASRGIGAAGAAGAVSATNTACVIDEAGSIVF